MHLLSPSEQDFKTALSYLQQAAELAKSATCKRAKCGTVIVNNDTIIGSGYNSPPAELASQQRCENDKQSYHRKVTDKTCCMHAEQRAIFDALRNHPDQLPGARLYFIRLDENDQMQHSGQPYCTICSKFALDTGIAEFVLWHEEGIAIYETEEYNNLSYRFTG